MFEVLERVESVMPSLLRNREKWTGVYADTAEPHLQRLWRQWFEYRVYLHLFEGCSREKSYRHPHPWRSAMRVWGGYEMGIGALGDDDGDLVVVRLEPGSSYEMTKAAAAHWVRPMGSLCFTVMVAEPVAFPENRISAQQKVRGLTSDERENLFSCAAYFYKLPDNLT